MVKQGYAILGRTATKSSNVCIQFMFSVEIKHHTFKSVIFTVVIIAQYCMACLRIDRLSLDKA